MNNLLEESLNQLKKLGFQLEVIRIISTGKEAVVYLVKEASKYYALKVYKNYEHRSFQKNEDYTKGNHFRNISEKRAVERKTRFGKKLSHTLWVKREFYLLRKLFSNNIPVPIVIEKTDNAILMQYLGTNEESARLLKDVVFDQAEKKSLYDKILIYIEEMKKLGIVHGDLSEFNIIYFEGQIYIIDFPQSIDIRQNPNFEEYITRDIENIHKWFEK